MRNWRNLGEPSFMKWLTEFDKVSPYEQISLGSEDRTEKYVVKWRSYLVYIAGVDESYTPCAWCSVSNSECLRAYLLLVDQRRLWCIFMYCYLYVLHYYFM